MFVGRAIRAYRTHIATQKKLFQLNNSTAFDRKKMSDSENYKSDDGIQSEFDPNVTYQDVLDNYNYEGESDGKYEYFAEGEEGFEAYEDRNKKVRVNDMMYM
uniref:Uncharacterized protein n=1 Tax=Sipha flava TaxID=143950 RepID=A0A2S2QG81_9HEMI